MVPAVGVNSEKSEAEQAIANLTLTTHPILFLRILRLKAESSPEWISAELLLKA